MDLKTLRIFEEFWEENKLSESLESISSPHSAYNLGGVMIFSKNRVFLKMSPLVFWFFEKKNQETKKTQPRFAIPFGIGRSPNLQAIGTGKRLIPHCIVLPVGG